MRTEDKVLQGIKVKLPGGPGGGMLSTLQAPFCSFFLMYVHKVPNTIFQRDFHYLSSVPPNQKQVTCLLVIVLNPYFLPSQKTFPCF